MYVKSRMKSDPVTIGPDASFYEAENLIRSGGIRHLPVVDKKKHVVGLVTDRDIREAGPSDASTLSIREMHYLLGKLQVRGIMTPLAKLVTVKPDTIVEKAAQLMYEHKIGCLPVLDDKKLVGIITETDMLELLVDIVGLNVKGTRITIAIPDEPGQMFGILQVINKYDVNIISIVSPTYSVEGRRLAVIRLKTQNVEPIVNDLKELNYEVTSTVEWPSSE
ncbi:MAG: CBS domain-containing protein [Proteobacteria bacterium]|nr:CBS domain-containing protein [Pseudomonadota bacterium]